MRIALHQMTSGIDLERNVLAMVNAITRSAEAGAAMYFAPEMSIIIDRDRVRARPHFSDAPRRPEPGRIRQGARTARRPWRTAG